MSRAKKRLKYFECKYFKLIRKNIYNVHQSCTLFTDNANGGCWKQCKIASGKAIDCAHYEKKD